jgi:hypothetical protein
LLDPLLSRRARLIASGAIEDVSWAPSVRLAAVIDDEGLRMLEAHRDHARWRIVGKSYACHFTASADALWVARPSAHAAGAWLELRDTGNGGTLHKLHIPDPFGASAFTLAPHADPLSIVVWMASPGAETQSIVVTLGSHGLAAQTLPMHYGYPPEPIPGSEEYLLVHEGVLERRHWSDHVARNQLHWPWSDDEDLAVLAISERFALWASRAGRIHLIDHLEMTFSDEIAVSVRSPRPLVEYFPESEDPHWGTDLHQFCSVGSQVILQFGETMLVSLAVADMIG